MTPPPAEAPPPSIVPPRIVLYDTTLRDGAQTQGVDFSVADKQAIAAELDRLGLDYIEGGWPGANPTDDAFFAAPPPLEHATLTAFGMTRRPGLRAAADPMLDAVLQAGTASVCLAGKTSDLAAEIALRVGPAENLAIIADSVAEAAGRGCEVLFAAEHFFDGYRRDPHYALACLAQAHQAGAGWLVLCDTNGGTLPDRIAAVVATVAAAFPGAKLGIHAHDDTETAVAGSLAAVAAGARMIQGTFNGLGERCGNANLTALIPTLMLKLGLRTGVTATGLARLTEISRMLDERLDRMPNRHAAYVGESAFAHKGGLHAAAAARDSSAYEHVAPAQVGNRRQIVVSNQAGRAGMLLRLAEAGIPAAPEDPRLPALVELVKQRAFEGYAYDDAAASFELLARRTLGGAPDPFCITALRVTEARRRDTTGAAAGCCDAAVTVEVAGAPITASAEAADPVAALLAALRRALLPAFPALPGLRLTEYRVRTQAGQSGGRPAIRVVVVRSQDPDSPALGHWSTVGVGETLIDAAAEALHDALAYRLARAPAEAPASAPALA